MSTCGARCSLSTKTPRSRRSTVRAVSTSEPCHAYAGVEHLPLTPSQIVDPVAVIDPGTGGSARCRRKRFPDRNCCPADAPIPPTRWDAVDCVAIVGPSRTGSGATEEVGGATAGQPSVGFRVGPTNLFFEAGGPAEIIKKVRVPWQWRAEVLQHLESAGIDSAVSISRTRRRRPRHPRLCQVGPRSAAVLASLDWRPITPWYGRVFPPRERPPVPSAGGRREGAGI